ncbi:hypothetical protein V1478_017152 [Vespula squamosa]|uniref:Uncharacterized protein n=1 Tax=Vespula squamosa TaxID=30214 RepID=A0ABD1ZYK7_VESSQ
MLILQGINKGSNRYSRAEDRSRIRVSASLKMMKKLVCFFYRRILIVVEILLLLVYKDVEFAHFLSTLIYAIIVSLDSRLQQLGRMTEFNFHSGLEINVSEYLQSFSKF